MNKFSYFDVRHMNLALHFVVWANGDRPPATAYTFLDPGRFFPEKGDLILYFSQNIIIEKINKKVGSAHRRN